MINKSAHTKRIALGVAGVLAALLFGWLFRLFINSAGTGDLIFMFAGAAVFLAVFLLQVVLAPDQKIVPILILLEALAMSVFFWSGLSVILAVGILANAGFLMAAYYAGTSAIRNNLDARFTRISRAIMGFATMAIALFVSFVYVGHFDIKDPAAVKKNLEAIIRPIEPLAARYLPGFSGRNTLRQIAAAALPADLQSASTDQKTEAVAQISARLADTFGNFAGVPVSSADRIVDIVYKATFGRILALTPVVQNLVLIGFGVVFFLLIKFLFFFVDWPAVLIGFGLYELLKATGFFKIEVQNVPKKVIVLE